MFTKASSVHRLLTNLSAVVDACVESSGRARYVVLRTRYEKRFGNGIKIQLADLDEEQKQQLLSAINKWAGNAQIAPRVEDVLLTLPPAIHPETHKEPIYAAAA
jgi:hypothetical protein